MPDKSAKVIFEKALSSFINVAIIGTGVLLLYTAEFGTFPTMVQRAIIISITLLFFYAGLAKANERKLPARISFLLLALIGITITFYIAFFRDDIAMRPTGPTDFELFIGTILVLMVLDVTRRAMGWALPIIASAFIMYAILGKYIPSGFFRHRGVPVEHLIQYLSMEVEGIWGQPIAVASTFIVLFVMLGAVMRSSGVGEYIVEISYSLMGRFRGGPAKMAVIASSLFGAISGSTVANVVGTGSFTIPLMKRVGYTREFAGAVESAASSGGQIVPPVMGAAAFIMAELLGMPYAEVCIAAATPAALYYLALFLSVDAEAVNTSLLGLPLKDLPLLGPLLKRIYLLLPVLVLIVLLMILEWSAMKAGFWAIVVTLILAFLNPSAKRKFRSALNAIGEGVKEMAPIVASCACAGLIIGAVSVTGIGLKISELLIEASGKNVYLLLFLTMIASLILGMGLPTVACYILLAILVAPAMINLGIIPIAAHLFVFYFGIISGITPPVAMAAFAASAISGGSYMKTAFVACKIALPAFIFPYMFALHPTIILRGSFFECTFAIISASLGIWILTAALFGYLFGFGRIRMWERVVLLITSLALIHPVILTTVIGLGVLTIIIVQWKLRAIRSEVKKTSTTA